MVDDAALALRRGGGQHFADDLFKARGSGIDGARQRIAAKRAEAHQPHFRRFAGSELHALVIDHDQRAVALHDRTLLGEIKRHDGDVLRHDVLPYVELGPIGKRKDPNGFALANARIVKLPQFGPLVLRIPGMVLGAEGKDALLGAAFFLVAPRAAESRIEAIFVQRLFQAFGLHHLGMQRRAGIERIDAALHAVLIDMDDQIETQPLRRLVTERDHLPELPGGVDMQQRKWRLGGIERLHRQMQHDRGILADRIEHDRLLELSYHLSHDEDAFGLQMLQMAEPGGENPTGFLGAA